MTSSSSLSFAKPLVVGLIAAQLSCSVHATWPQPSQNKPAVSRHPAERQTGFAPIRTQPNFSSPSAIHCAKPTQMREIGTHAQTREGDLMLSGSPVRPSAPVLAGPAPAPKAALSPVPVAAAAAARVGVGIESATHAASRPDAGVVQRKAEVVTAGLVDDNQDFERYLAFVRKSTVAHHVRDVGERHLVEVKDERGNGVPDAEVQIHASSGAAAWARTDSAGRFWLHLNAFDAARSPVYQITARRDGVGAQSVPGHLLSATALLKRGQRSSVELRLGAAAQQRAQLDLVFLVDATGSMGDEIDKLKTSLATIVAEVARLPSRPDLCLALVAYRDRGDAFVVRSHDFTNDVSGFQSVLNQLQAGGGGDYPEAMAQDMEEAVQHLSWRGGLGLATSRLVVLVADAPPHLIHDGAPYDDSMVAALGKGIKIFSVGASGLDKQGEFIQRQIAQFTGGKFVFLTYAKATDPASGPGRETIHDVNNYGVDTLDRLIVRLVR